MRRTTHGLRSIAFLVALVDLGGGPAGCAYDLDRTDWSDDRPGIMDPDGIKIMTGQKTQILPRAASAGAASLVAWQDGRYWGQPRGGTIYGNLVNAGGGVTGPSDGLPICTEFEDQGLPAVASDGTSYLVVWWDDRFKTVTEKDIYGVIVDKTGKPLGADFPVCQASGPQDGPNVAFDGTNYLVVWSDQRDYTTNGIDVYGIRVSPAGKLVGSEIEIVADKTDQDGTHLAFDGINYLVVWLDERNAKSTGQDIYGIRVNTSGQRADPAPILISGAPGDQSQPRVASVGASSLVVWTDERNRSATGEDIYGARVTNNGDVLDPSGLPLCTTTGDQRWPWVATDKFEYLIAWTDKHGDAKGDILGARVHDDGNVATPGEFAISATAASQDDPSITWTGAHFLVVWKDDRAEPGLSDIFGARLTF